MVIEGRKGKGGGRVATEATDTLRSTQIAEVLDLVSEGPIQGLVNGLQSVYLDGVPLRNADNSENFENVSFAWTLGTQGQAALHGFDLVQNEVAVALKVTKIAPVVRTVLVGSDTVRVTIGVPQLSFQDPANGDMVGNKVEYAIDLQSNGGGYVEVYHATIDGKTMSHYQRSTLVTLTGTGPWDIRVRRLTDDSTKSNSTNAVYWDSYTEIQTARLRYPNSAIHGLRVNAQQFGRVPTRGYDIMGRVIQVPSCYNPLTRSYAGVWDGTFVPAWSNNPAWVFYDLLTHPRYGLGQYVQAAYINKWRLYQIAQYCDELVPDGRGGHEPRFTCNLYLQSQNDAYKTLQDIAAIFRGILLYGNGVVDAVQDAPSDALSLFTPANVIDGKFVYQGASERTRHSGVIVYWNNLANQGKREPELYQDEALVSRFGVRNLELSPLGTWSRGQAVRLAKWALYSEDSEGEVVSFSVGSEGAMVPMGRVFKIADPSVSGERLGGRVKTASANTITLDRAVTLASGVAYTLTVALPDAGDPFNLVSEKRNVLHGQDGGTALVLDVPYSSLPAANAIWLLESTQVVATTWRCIGMREVPGEDRYEITGVAHSPDKYLLIEQGIKLEAKPISLLKPGATKPTDLLISETVYTAGGAAKSRLSISWVPGAPGMYYRVSWRAQGGVWTVMPDTSAQTVDLVDVLPGTIDIAVRAINGLGSVSMPLEGSYTVGGKTSTGNVVGLVLRVTATGIEAAWSGPTGVDGATWAQTELRRGPNFAAGTNLFKGRATSFNLGWLAAGDLTVWAVHSDSSGNASEPVSATLQVNVPAQPVLSGNVDVTVVKLSWQDCKTTQPIGHYTLKRGGSWVDGRVLGDISALMTTLLEVTEGRWSFWCAAVDMGGNVGAPGYVTVDVGSPISAILAQLNAGLTESVSEINALGESVGTITAHVDDITTKIDSPTIGLEAQKASASMLALALQQAREASAALDLGQLLMLHKTDTTIRDAGIVTDPTTGNVTITGLEQTATSLTKVKADFDAMQGTVILQAQRITQLNTDLINAQLDPTGAAVVSGVITQVNDVKQTLDAVNATLTQKASSAIVGEHYLQLQQAVQTLSQHGSDLLVIAQTVNALQNDLATADSRLVVLEHSAESTTELVAARLADQAKIEALSADALAGLLTGEAGKQDVVKQLAYAKTSLKADVDTLGQSVAQQLTTMTTIVAGNRADYEAKVALLTTADSTEATVRQVLALKQQTDHNTVTAGVASESGARIAADAAEATARQTLAVKQQSDADTLAAGLQTEAATRVSANSALSSQLTTLTASVNSNTAAVQTEALARATAIVAEASARQTLEAKVNGNKAAYDDKVTLLTNADSALSGQITTLTAGVADAKAAVQTESNARVTGDSAQAQALTAVQANLNGAIASVAQKLSTVIGPDGKAIAAYTLALNVNNRVTGVRVDNNGLTSNFVVQSDKFAFVLPGQNEEKPILVAGKVDGVQAVGINGSLYVDGSVEARALNVKELSAVTANLGTIKGAQVSLTPGYEGQTSYIRSGTKWWDEQNGWVLAQEPGDNFIDFKVGECRLRMHSGGGDCRLQFPGITMTNGGLTISQANVIDTLQLQGNAVTVPMSAQAYPNVSLGAGSLALLVSSGWQYMLPPAYVSVIVTVAGIATGGSTDCRVRCMLTASYGGTTPIFDLGCTMVKGDSQTPTFSGSIAVPHGEYWKVDVYVGNDWYDGQWTCKQVSLTAFGAKR